MNLIVKLLATIFGPQLRRFVMQFATRFVSLLLLAPLRWLLSSGAGWMALIAGAGGAFLGSAAIWSAGPGELVEMIRGAHRPGLIVLPLLIVAGALVVRPPFLKANTAFGASVPYRVIFLGVLAALAIAAYFLAQSIDKLAL